MGFYYFDASVVVKYYVTEPGSDWVRELVEAAEQGGQPRHQLVSVIVTAVEVPTAMSVICRTGRISIRIRDLAYRNFLSTFVHRYRIVGLDAQLAAIAGDLTQAHTLKALDAIHLAAALRTHAALSSMNQELTFVSGDRKLLTAAEAEGLVTENPFEHTDG